MIRSLHISFLLLLLVSFSDIKAQLVINEFMASNQDAFDDGFNSSSDWIEIYNVGNTAVNWSGYYLSDNLENPLKWQLPNGIIGPNSHTIVFASNRDTFDGEFYHTSFKLSSNGEDVVLSNQNGEVIDQTSFSSQYRDISFGRNMDGASNWVFFDPSSPNETNDPNDFIDPSSMQVVLSHTPGFYEEAFELQMTVVEEAFDIYYTLDGRQPDTMSSKYIAPLLLDEDNMPEIFLSHIPTSISWRIPIGEINRCHVIRAQAFMGNDPVGKEVRGSYFVEDKDDDRYSVPVLSIITPPENLFDPDTGIYHTGNNENFFQDDWERPAHIEYFEDEGELALATDIGIQVTGGLSRIRPQKSIKFYARDIYGDSEINHNFFGDDYSDEFERLSIRALNNNWTPTAIGDDFAQEFSYSHDMEYEYQRRKFVVVFINGEYWGVHSLRETTDEEFISNRMDVDEDDVIIEGQEHADFKSYVINTDMTNPQVYNEVINQIDINSLLDYYCFELFLANHDWPHNNNKAWKLDDNESKWRWIFFDLDGSFQQYKHGYFRMFFEPLELHVKNDRIHGFMFFRSLLENEEFRSLFRAKMIFHLNNTFSPENTIPKLQEVKSEIIQEMEEHIRRWQYPNGIRRWAKSVENLGDFMVIRNNVLLSEVFEFMGIPMDVYPNPVINNLMGELDLGTNQLVNFYFIDMHGRMAFLGEQQMLAGNNQFSFDITSLQGGTYLLTAITDFQIYSKKVIVSH